MQFPRDEGIQGYFYKSDDGKNIARFRKDGFTFSRLKPYTDWESVLVERCCGTLSNRSETSGRSKISIEDLNGKSPADDKVVTTRLLLVSRKCRIMSVQASVAQL